MLHRVKVEVVDLAQGEKTYSIGVDVANVPAIRYYKKRWQADWLALPDYMGTEGEYDFYFVEKYPEDKRKARGLVEIQCYKGNFCLYRNTNRR